MLAREVTAKYFDTVAEGNGVPIYRQLKDCIERFIMDQDDNSPFPSERELCKALGINRRTLRQAIEPFVLRGMLRRSQKRTLISKGGTKPAPSHVAEPTIHPFTLDVPMATFSHKTKLRMLLYESLPFQKNFWHSVIEKFNKKHTAVEMEGVWCPPHSSSPYWDAFRAGACDLAHLPVSYSWTDDLPELLQPVDTELLKRIQGPEFRSGAFCQDEPHVLRSSVPIGFSFAFINWNKKQLRALCREDPGKLLRHPFTDCLRTAVSGLSKDAFVALVFYDSIRDLGLPTIYDQTTVETHCRIVIERIGILRKRKGRLFVDSDPTHATCPQPCDAEVLLRGTFGYAVGMDRTLKEACQRTIPTPRSDSKYWGVCSSLGVFRQSRNTEAAQLFVEFMLSGPIQQQLAEEMWQAPVLRRHDDALAAKLNASPDELDAYLAQNRENPRAHPPPVGMGMVPWIDKLFAGKIDEETTLRNTLMYFQLPTFISGPNLRM